MGFLNFLSKSGKDSLRKNLFLQKYYFDYEVKPYISADRDMKDWAEKVKMFPKQNIIPRATMTRYDDGLLPGHVYMLYWLGKYANKKIPAYFEYKYGINFEAEKDFLAKNGYLEGGKPTERAEMAISAHQRVIETHAPKREGISRRKVSSSKRMQNPDEVKHAILMSKSNLLGNGYTHYEYISEGKACPKCKALNGKVFPLSQLKPGVNAPPMCEECRCSIAAYIDRKEYEAWLDFVSKGGTSKQWEKRKKKQSRQ